MRPTTSVTVGALALALGIAGSAQADTLEDVQARGTLNCIVSTGIAGFAYPDDAGEWHGFDIDFCRATAAAVLGDPNAIKAVTSTGKTRFTKLNAGEGDVLWRNTTITFSRDVGVKLRFHGVNYYDGQGFMVPKALGVSSAKELDGASVCIQTGTTTELNLADYFHSNGMKYEAVTIETNDEARQNYLAGPFGVYTTDASGLASTRSTFTDPENHIVLPEIISKELLGPATRHGDDRWSDIVIWIIAGRDERECEQLDSELEAKCRLAKIMSWQELLLVHHLGEQGQQWNSQFLKQYTVLLKTSPNTNQFEFRSPSRNMSGTGWEPFRTTPYGGLGGLFR